MKWLSGLLLFALASCTYVDEYPASATVKVLVGQGHGSGVHIGDGYVLTAAHVVDNTGKLTIKDDSGVTHDAELLWSNRKYDVAMVRLADFSTIRPASLSCRVPGEGEAILATGNPSEVEFLTFRGFIAGKLRQLGPWASAVPTDMTAIGGMSGGPVFDADGNVAGLTVGHLVIPMGFGASWTRAGVIVPGAAICDLMARTV